MEAIREDKMMGGERRRHDAAGVKESVGSAVRCGDEKMRCWRNEKLGRWSFWGRWSEVPDVEKTLWSGGCMKSFTTVLINKYVKSKKKKKSVNERCRS